MRPRAGTIETTAHSAPPAPTAHVTPRAVPGALAGPYTGAVARGDGRLTHDIDPQDVGPQDACGVFGVWAPGEEVAKLSYFGLYALQHRGQESAGVVSNQDGVLHGVRSMGQVGKIFSRDALAQLPGHQRQPTQSPN